LTYPHHHSSWHCGKHLLCTIPLFFWLAMDEFQPESRPKVISLRLVAELSMTKPELADFELLDAEEALVKARSMKTIHLEWSNIAEISNLEPYEATEVLYLQYNCISRIENLEWLTKLQFLALQGNCIKEIANLESLQDLQFLDLSKNQIENLNERGLPSSINILNLKDNPCRDSVDYTMRLRARLPELVYLDGVDIQDGIPMANAVAAGRAEEEILTGIDQGLGAYYRKNELQASTEANIKERIEAYSIESLADVDGFDLQVENATARSRARRDGLGASSSMRSGEMPSSAPLLE